MNFFNTVFHRLIKGICGTGGDVLCHSLNIAFQSVHTVVPSFLNLIPVKGNYTLNDCSGSFKSINNLIENELKYLPYNLERIDETVYGSTEQKGNCYTSG